MGGPIDGSGTAWIGADGITALEQLNLEDALMQVGLLSQRIAELESIENSNDERISLYETALVADEVVVNAMQATIDGLETELTDAKDRAAVYQEALGEDEAEIDVLNGEISDLGFEVESLTSEINDAEGEAMYQEDVIAELVLEANELQQEIEDLIAEKFADGPPDENVG